MDRPAVRDGALLVLRLILGVIFISHGWDKIFITGVDKTTGYFVAAGIPQAEITVWLVAIIELVGGALLILGLLAPAVAMVLVVTMLGALWAVHLGNGLFMRDDGAELFLVPIENCIDALAAGNNDDMQLVMVQTMHDARTSIEAWVADQDAELPSCEDADEILAGTAS